MRGSSKEISVGSGIVDVTLWENGDTEVSFFDDDGYGRANAYFNKGELQELIEALSSKDDE